MEDGRPGREQGQAQQGGPIAGDGAYLTQRPCAHGPQYPSPSVRREVMEDAADPRVQESRVGQ